MRTFVSFSIVLLVATLLAASASFSRMTRNKEKDEVTNLLRDLLGYLRKDGKSESQRRLKAKILNIDTIHEQDHFLNRPQSLRGTSCGRPHRDMAIDKRIIGGHTALPHSWPWQVRLLKKARQDEELKDVCGGTVITPRYVVTAAHCVWDSLMGKKDENSKFVVIAGDHDRTNDADGPVQESLVEDVFVHSNYNATTSMNDIAIVSLTTVLNFNENISDCCLPRINPAKEKLCYATGWGATEKGGSNLLKQVRLPLFSMSECAAKFYGELVWYKMLCAGYEGGYKDTCQGDSGGPLVCFDNDRWVLEGVTSWGVGCGLPMKPGVYTKVSSYLGWIKSVVDASSTHQSQEVFAYQGTSQ